MKKRFDIVVVGGGMTGLTLAALLVHFESTGMMCSIGNLAAPRDAWRPAAIPIASMLHLEVRKGKEKRFGQKIESVEKKIGQVSS